MLRNDAVRLCQENNFNTGFFEGSDNNSVVDAYELKVILHSTLLLLLLMFGSAFYKENNFPSSFSLI
jgi:atypical dual specificity phosphatase